MKININLKLFLLQALIIILIFASIKNSYANGLSEWPVWQGYAETHAIKPVPKVKHFVRQRSAKKPVASFRSIQKSKNKNNFYETLNKGYNITKADVESYPSFLSKHPYYLMGLGALIAGSFMVDKSIRGYAVAHRNVTAAKIASNLVYPFGKFYYMLPAAGILAFYGYDSKNYKLEGASLTALESAFAAGALTEGIKVAAGRERPYYTDDPMKFKPFNFADSYNSMPSGDAAIAWSVITPYALYYNEPILYVIPAAVNLERVYKNKHWFSDTIVGAAIGFSIGYLFSENHLSKKFKKFSVSVEPMGEGALLNVKFK